MHSAHGTQLQRAIVEDTSMIQRWELFHLADRNGLTPPGIVGLKAYKVMPSGDTSSNEAFEWAMRRLQACNQSHKCYRLDSLFKPSRVVDVSSFKESQDVILIDGSSMRDSRYVALSHCWGSFIPPCKTTQATLLDRKTRISWALLPRTFQDAVTFIRRLHIQYLWIDTLCIVQDDLNDWLAESGKMHSLYANSYLTIAATSSRDSRGGLFATARQPVRVATVLAGESRHDIFARPLLNHIFSGTYLETNEEELPLLTRAWAFQERLLAPRILFFTQSELAWECQETWDCECKNLGENKSASSGTKHFRGLVAQTRPALTAQTQPAIKTGIWHVTVTHYSNLGITKDTDRLPAFAGVAQEMMKYLPGQRYLAGLWSGSLQENLMWYTFSSTSSHLDRPQRTQSWVPPTWSWASIPTEVFFNTAGKDTTAVFEVMDSSCQLASNSLFGPVNGGRLVLLAKLLTQTMVSFVDDSWPTIKYDRFKFRFYPDISTETVAQSQNSEKNLFDFHLLAGAITVRTAVNPPSPKASDPQPRVEFRCLVIVQTQPNIFQRAGFARLCAEDLDLVKEVFGLFGEYQEVIII